MMFRKARATRLTAMIIFLVSGAIWLHAQVDLSGIIGVPEHARVLPIRLGFVNLDNGNLHLEIPLYSNPERGHPAQTNTLVYDSMFWNSAALTGGTTYMLYPTTAGWGGGGQFYPDDMGGAVTGSIYQVLSCAQVYGQLATGSINVYTSFSSVDPRNTTRTFSFQTQNLIADAQCFYANGQPNQGQPYPNNNDPTIAGYGYPQNGTAYAQDGSGYRLIITKANNFSASTIISPSGTAESNGTGQLPTTPNGNNFDINDRLVDELGESYPTQSGTTSIIYFYNNQSNYLSYQPYQAKSPVTGTLTRSVWDGTTGQLANAVYTYTWEYIPVCTGNTSTDYCGGMWVLSSLSIPGGQYQFTYDQGTSPGHLGNLTGVTLPTGGTMGFSYGGLTCGTRFCGGQVQSVTDQGAATAISYSAPSNGIDYYPVTVTLPAHVTSAGGTATVQDQIVYTSSTNTPEQDTFTKKEYSGTSTVLRTTTTVTDTYSRPTSVKSVWATTGESHEVDFKYADDPSVAGTMTYGQLGIDMITLETEYDSGALVRSMQTTYLQDTSAIKYVSQYNMINYPSLVKVMDATGAVISQTQYTYDEYSASYCSQSYPQGLSGIAMLTAITGAAGHDDTGHGTGFVARGNLTTIAQSGVNLASPVVTHKCYDTLGNVTQSIDGNGNATRFDYTDKFYETSCVTTGSPTYAFLTTMTNALGQQTITKYYSCNRVPYSVQGPNDLVASPVRSGTIYSYDSATRPHCTNFPDGGQTCKSYPSLTETDSTTLLNASGAQQTVQTMVDGFGRVTATIDDGAGVETDTSYDYFGRVNSISNPYSTGGSTNGTTYFAYDPIGRKSGQKQQDGNMQSWSYSGNTVTFTNEKSNQWKQTSDGLGRLAKVLEPNGTTGTPSLESDYTYDVLSNLTCVEQHGGVSGTGCSSSPSNDATSPWHVRRFTYDALSRLVSSANPESGAVNYNYDGDGNVSSRVSPAVNSTTGTQTISYCYDGLSRITYKFYTGSINCKAPTGFAASYTYDTSGVAGSQNVIGRLTDEKSYIGNTLVAERQLYSYDPMGRLLNENQYTLKSLGSGTPFKPAYFYDLAGNVIASTDGATQIPSQNATFPCTVTSSVQNTVSSWTTLGFFNCYDNASRLSSMTSNWTLPYSGSIFTIGANGYSPANQLQNWSEGSSSALSVSQTYTNRLWLNSITATGKLP